jgi:hypothetical protein
MAMLCPFAAVSILGPRGMGMGCTALWDQAANHTFG